MKLQQRRPREKGEAHGWERIKRARYEKACDVYTTKTGKIGRDALLLENGENDPERFR